jgi:hypothetical protein
LSVNNVGFDITRTQPPRQPEAVTSGLKGDGDTRDIAAGLDRFVAPPLQQPQQRLLVRNQLLQRVAFHPRNNAGDEPARLAHLDDRNERAILTERNERSA